MLRTSRLHRLLGIRPGHVPKWFAACRSCGLQLDLIWVLHCLPILGAIVLFRFSYTVAAASLIASVVVFSIWLGLPFEKAERAARARIRRRECVACGAKRKDAEDYLCTKCERSEPVESLISVP